MHKSTLMTVALVVGAWALPGCDKEEESTTIGLPMGQAGSENGDDDDDEDPGDDDDDEPDDDDDDDDRPDDDDDDDDTPGADDDDDDDDPGGSSPGMDSPCCVAQDGPGCAADPDVESCVCAVDSFCCEDTWDDLCAAMINVEGCGMCAETPGDPDDGPDLPDEPSDCCTPSSMPGCTMPEVEACVCAQDEFCCSDQWDFVCITEVNEFECGIMCDVPDPGGDLPDEPSDCCTPTAQPGCTDMAIESCVCEQDEFCCMTNWDAFCVDEVAEFMCGECPDAGA